MAKKERIRSIACVVKRTLAILVFVYFAAACGTHTPAALYPELGLAGPCEIQRWEGYSDGGSRGGTLRDSRGRVLKISWDGRMRIVGSDNLQSPHLAYINAEHPSQDGAIPLPLGSDIEMELIALFDAWVLTQIPADSLDAWFSVYFDHSIPREERMKQLPRLTDSQRRALSVTGTSRYLKRQRESGYAPGSEDLPLPGEWPLRTDQPDGDGVD